MPRYLFSLACKWYSENRLILSGEILCRDGKLTGIRKHYACSNYRRRSGLNISPNGALLCNWLGVDLDGGDKKGPHGAIDGGRTVTLAEVAQHNTFEDCWIIIDNAVYDISEWKDHHPGGPFVARMYAGKDATAEFGEYHSKRAERHMQHFRVGYLEDGAGYSA